MPHTLYKDAVIMLESPDPKLRKQSSTIFRRLANFLIYEKESWQQMKGKEVCEKFKNQIDAIIGMCIVKLFYVTVFVSLKHFFLIKAGLVAWKVARRATSTAKGRRSRDPVKGS